MRRILIDVVFVLAVLALAGYGVQRIGARHWRWRETFRARAEFATIGGLEAGGKVRVQGMDAGIVEEVRAPERPGRPVTLVLRIDARLRPLVRADAKATIVAQGVVGGKVVEVVPGRPEAPALADGGLIAAEAPVEVADLIRDASGSLKRLDATVAAAETGLNEINAIAATIRQGRGTLGRLVQDDEAYRKLVALSSRGEKTLSDLEENLEALKRTWPISRYFDRRGFNDRDRILYQPGAERESRTLAAADLFEPNRAVLTAQGRRHLDNIAAWCKPLRRPATEIVIAAFTDAPRDEDLAQILTQEQADTVRNYLISRHSLDAKGWFGTRKVAAVGFGTQVPRFPPGAPAAPTNPPPRRVEIILFTPQA
ncbi:MAG TPA: MlaD family protein [Isosphaeraceae bacterium]|jgi:phospholipid/cholesterol/gamma-HCH transport system substrate-binding protein|nr:MlaD family protein [Isosphaeraceae bacterium]